LYIYFYILGINLLYFNLQKYQKILFGFAKLPNIFYKSTLKENMIFEIQK